ncbi:S-adenosylmethionine:tRNA ribosyltransferase-isomerase [Fredinandcohnia sp. 179-A 10B2 NHS]|uniref:S-adenosylmethionine:tRNA ribosyltransferase-isomerase n=1 Tax=Fredinandcohnia sp. 179-A 10B2 NHS TaxID=3235176 RepID=UPI00399F9EA7
MVETIQFEIPAHLNATIPAERRGVSRDSVRLMVMDGTSTIQHDTFKNLGLHLRKGDLLVMNSSRTIPCVLYGRQGDRPVEIRLSRKISENEWDVLVVNGSKQIGERIEFYEGVTAIIADYGSEEPLVRLHFSKGQTDLINMFYKYGEPIRYEYINQPWSLDNYQTVYATIPGSVEMTSAGRAFSWKLLQELKKQGINLAFLQLHAGLSYYGDDQWPTPNKHPEPYILPPETAQLVNKTRENGGRVIAVGTTVVRALESAVDGGGVVKAREGVTDLYITSGYSLKVIDGLLTGLHEPEASHLDLLSAFVRKDYLEKCYQIAVAHEYLWHEFGDMNLIFRDETKQ